MTRAGIEPATLRFVPQYINQFTGATPYTWRTKYNLHLKPLILSSKFVCIICTRFTKSNFTKIVLRSHGDTALFTAGRQ